MGPVLCQTGTVPVVNLVTTETKETAGEFRLLHGAAGLGREKVPGVIAARRPTR
jgi:hypothetical protein